MMLRKFLLRSVPLALLIGLGGPLTGDPHHAVLRFNIEEMTATADRIFLGQCVAVEETEEFMAGGLLPVTRYTFEVEQAIKGQLPRRLTFRQLGHPPHRASKGAMAIHGMAATPSTFFHGMAEYRVGQRVVLFLIPNYLGGRVTYPVGLYQGAFLVTEMPSGQVLVRNSINNLGLHTAPYNGTSMKEQDARVIFPQRGEAALSQFAQTLFSKRGALPLDQFLELVEQIVVTHGGGARGVIVDSKKGAIQR